MSVDSECSEEEYENVVWDAIVPDASEGKLPRNSIKTRFKPKLQFHDQ
jgi:hypothetical protein